MRGLSRVAVAGVCVLSIAALPDCAGSAGSAIQRSETATKARAAMVGMPKEDVLACMGLPGAKGAEGETEVWTYASGDDRVNTFTTANAFTAGQSHTNGNVAALGNTATFGSNTAGSANTSAFGFGTTRRFYCTINVVFRDGMVSRVNYSGPTGPLAAPGEQCAYAVQNCPH
jgi:hypothetical protein